jgi:hypothetical protein
MENGTYNSKSCNNLEKPYYKPVEAALRWCGLHAHEQEIIKATGANLMPPKTAFPQWPCLFANVEKIVDAMDCGELAVGRDGKPATGEQVAAHRRTARHTELKAWMARNYPDQKPAFLFDEVERNTHSAINKEAFAALQIELQASKARVEKAKEAYRELQTKNAALQTELDKKTESSPRERATLMRIIAVLAELAITPKKGRTSEAALIDEMLTNYSDKAGISKTTLENKFAEAKKILQSD